MGLIELIVAAAIGLGLLGVQREPTTEPIPEPQPPTMEPIPEPQPEPEPIPEPIPQPLQEGPIPEPTPQPLQEGEIFLSLRDNNTNTSVTGAVVTLLDKSLPPPGNPQPFIETTTGSYLISRILPGLYDIDIIAQGYESIRIETTLLQGESKSLTKFLIPITPTVTPTFRQPVGFTLNGITINQPIGASGAIAINANQDFWIIYDVSNQSEIAVDIGATAQDLDTLRILSVNSQRGVLISLGRHTGQFFMPATVIKSARLQVTIDFAFNGQRIATGSMIIRSN